MAFFWDYCPLNMELIDCPDTSVRNYHDSLRNSPEERSSHLLRGGNLKSRIRNVCYLTIKIVRLVLQPNGFKIR